MQVKLTDSEFNAIHELHNRGYPFWEAIYDSLSQVQDRYGKWLNVWDVNDDPQSSQEVVDAYADEAEAGHDPLSQVSPRLADKVADIVDHMEDVQGQ